MKPQQSKLKQQQAQSETKLDAVQQAAAREFQSAEEVIRADFAQTKVPDAVKTRLADSLARESPKPKGPWWKRMFS